MVSTCPNYFIIDYGNMEASHGKGGFTYKKARGSTCMGRELNKESMLPYRKESKLITYADFACSWMDQKEA